MKEQHLEPRDAAWAQFSLFLSLCGFQRRRRNALAEDLWEGIKLIEPRPFH